VDGGERGFSEVMPLCTMHVTITSLSRRACRGHRNRRERVLNFFFNSSPDAETHIYTGRTVFPNSAFFVTVEKNSYFYTRVAINR
jgi:hypothetical protein